MTAAALPRARARLPIRPASEGWLESQGLWHSMSSGRSRCGELRVPGGSLNLQHRPVFVGARICPQCDAAGTPAAQQRTRPPVQPAPTQAPVPVPVPKPRVLQPTPVSSPASTVVPGSAATPSLRTAWWELQLRAHPDAAFERHSRYPDEDLALKARSRVRQEYGDPYEVRLQAGFTSAGQDHTSGPADRILHCLADRPERKNARKSQATGAIPRATVAASHAPVASSPVASSPVASSPVASSPVASSPVASSPVAGVNEPPSLAGHTSPAAAEPRAPLSAAAALLSLFEATVRQAAEVRIAELAARHTAELQDMQARMADLEARNQQQARMIAELTARLDELGQTPSEPSRNLS